MVQKKEVSHPGKVEQIIDVPEYAPEVLKVEPMPAKLDLLKTQKDLLELRSREATLRLRVQFAYIMVGLVGLSNLGTMIVLFLLGFHVSGFDLSDTVVVAAISATVAELASVFLIIVKFLFHVEMSIESD